MFSIELLISEVEKIPCLWDLDDKKYSNRDEKKKGWIEVATKVFNDWENIEEGEKTTKLDDIKKKWKNVKDYYKKEKKGMTSRSAAKKKKKYVYFEMLKFLDKNIKRRSITYNISHPNESFAKESTGCQITDDSELFLKPKSNATPFRKPKMNEFQNSVRGVLSRRKKNQGIVDDRDEDKLFLLSFLPTLKNMPSYQKFDFKIQMTQVLKNINFQNQYNSPKTHTIFSSLQNASNLKNNNFASAPTNNYIHQCQHPIQKYFPNKDQSSMQKSIPTHYQSSVPNFAVNPYQNLAQNSYEHHDLTFSLSPTTTSNELFSNNLDFVNFN